MDYVTQASLSPLSSFSRLGNFKLHDTLLTLNYIYAQSGRVFTATATEDLRATTR